MIQLIRLALCIAICGLACACATSYGPRDAGAGAQASGYVDRELKPGIHEVYYNANAYTSPKKAKALWHQRAAELCAGSDYGYDLREDEDFSSSMAYASGMVYTSNAHSPRFYGLVNCSESGQLSLFAATRAEQRAAKNPEEVIRIPDGVEPVSQIRLTCGNYYPLERHCSIFGAGLNLSFDGVKFRIAASAQGDKLYLELPEKAPAYKDKYEANGYINTVYYLVEALAVEAGLRVQQVRPVKSLLFGVQGYLVAFNGNVYSLLIRDADRDTPTISSGLDVDL